MSVNDLIRQIDANSWLISETLLLCRKQTPDAPTYVPSSDNNSRFLASWSDSNGGLFVLSNLSGPPLRTQPLETDAIQKVYDIRNVSAVWRVGEAFIKLKDLKTPNATREHVTLQYVRNKQPLSFRIPDVYYHEDLGPSRYLIVLGKVAGQTLNELWFDMEEPLRRECVRRIAEICKDLATWKGTAICGVDGKYLTEHYLTRTGAAAKFDSDTLLKNCKASGMDCSSFVFYHCDLGPGNILLDKSDMSIAIIDWEIAGYVPKEWICTKFRCSSGHNLPQRAGCETFDWRVRVGRVLEKLEFYDVADEWLAWLTGGG